VSQPKQPPPSLEVSIWLGQQQRHKQERHQREAISPDDVVPDSEYADLDENGPDPYDLDDDGVCGLSVWEDC
jgi:hypothetical protein